MAIITVQGLIHSDEAGLILPHEHILLDLTNQYREYPEASKVSWAYQKVSVENLGILSRNPLALKDNLLLDDVECAEREILMFKKAGGGTIVDVTNVGIGRDPVALYGISRSIGVHIVAGSGYYYHDTHPEDMDKKTAEQIRDEIVGDISVGIDETVVRAGVIGEIGISEEMQPNEEKVLIGVAQAQAAMGVGVQVHIFPWNPKGFPLGREALKILIQNGADARKVSINHVDVAMDINLDYIKAIVEQGALVEFDNFGHEYYVDRRSRKFLPGPFATDVQRIKSIVALVEEGYLANILISSDICHKSLLHQYGGWGYDHVPTNVIPMLREFGLSSEQIKTITEENPKNFLNTDMF
jgi:phosphotriesterase-related protein